MAALAEDEFDVLEPTPDIFALFEYYNSLYFDGCLGACSVEWSSARMTLCAGVCRYMPAGGCRITLSEPLLKYRPTRDLKETLLHEMIHAYCFLMKIRDDQADGHGSAFVAKMRFINAATFPDSQRPLGGYNITVYHDMIAEVNNYRTHIWKCDRCSSIVRRAMNRAPQAADCRGRKGQRGPACRDAGCRWHEHLRTCGGSYTKIAEPEGYGRKKQPRGNGAAGPAKRPKLPQNRPGASILEFFDRVGSVGGGGGDVPRAGAGRGGDGGGSAGDGSRGDAAASSRRAGSGEAAEVPRSDGAEAAAGRSAAASMPGAGAGAGVGNRSKESRTAASVPSARAGAGASGSGGASSNARGGGGADMIEPPQAPPPGDLRRVLAEAALCRMQGGTPAAEASVSGPRLPASMPGLGGRAPSPASNGAGSSSSGRAATRVDSGWGAAPAGAPPPEVIDLVDEAPVAGEAGTPFLHAGEAAVVRCPICGRGWPGGQVSNAQLNRHVDACLVNISG